MSTFNISKTFVITKVLESKFKSKKEFKDKKKFRFLANFFGSPSNEGIQILTLVDSYKIKIFYMDSILTISI